ncbi:MAG: SPFH domain-containing protein [Candidatus Hodarchaeales archaeon]|jgi:regulator of protease activity HflC (stomatin/prohibitin superfamily)
MLNNFFLQFDNLNLIDLIAPAFVLFFVVFLLFIIFYISRFKKFKTNEYVIHFRRGKVKRSGTGGTVILWPVFDEVVVIPTTVQQTLLEAKEKVVSYEYQDVALTAFVYWRVNNPEVSFSKVSWNPTRSDYIEKAIKNATEAIIRTTCANMKIEQIIRNRAEIIKNVTSELHSLAGDWGITVESVEIRDVEVLDDRLKDNLEAVKKIEEAQNAQLRQAEMEELVQLRNLEVRKKTGESDQHVKLSIESKAKDREIKIASLEQERAIIAAETERRQKQINAEAEKYLLVTQEVGVEAERIRQQAEARKDQLLAEAEGEAAKIRQTQIAIAEGILEQAKALSKADEKYIQLRTIDMLPEVFRNISVDRMILLGEGKDAYKSIAQMVLPFLELANEMGLTSRFSSPDNPGNSEKQKRNRS